MNLDPALNYDFIGWRIEMATCARLLWYPDKRGNAGRQLTPEVAAGFPRVSRGGKEYTFTIRPGYRFSDGSPVTAASFAHAINRNLTKKLQSYAAPFLADVVGAQAVLSGKRTTASGVSVSGNRLTVRLTKVAPDFLAQIAMPFFCAVPENMPPEIDNTPLGSGPTTLPSSRRSGTWWCARTPITGAGGHSTGTRCASRCRWPRTRATCRSGRARRTTTWRDCHRPLTPSSQRTSGSTRAATSSIPPM